MSKAFAKVRRFIERHAMLDNATGILVAVSGGPDSVALLDMLLRLVSSAGEPASIGAERRHAGTAAHLGPETPIHVAHLDHMLRGRGSAEDAEFVRELADRRALQSTIRSADVRAAAEACGRGIEEIAREIRYGFLLTAAREAGCNRIAVGHTMTDQAETFLMRLIRGAGLRGLAAMRPVMPAHTFEQIPCSPSPLLPFSPAPPLPRSPVPLLIRPLLCITREEVGVYCKQRGLEVRTDSTNRDSHYTRNQIRIEALPALRAVNPRVIESIARAAENIAGDQDVLDGLASSLLKEARVEPDAWRNVADGDPAAYSVNALLKQPTAMRRRMIIEAIRLASLMNGTEGARSGRSEIGSTHVASVEGLLQENASGSRVTLPGGLEAWRDFDVLAFTTAAPAEEEPAYEFQISASRPRAEAGGFAFVLQRDQSVDLLKPTIQEAQCEARRDGRDWMIVALDDDAVPEHLAIRPRRPGERALVIGQRRTKKLKNLMIDHRIPSSRRANWPVVTTPDGCYIWSPGLPPALKFAAHDETQRFAMVRASAI